MLSVCAYVHVLSHLGYVTLYPLSIGEDFIPHDKTPSKSLGGWRGKKKQREEGDSWI